MSRGLPAPEGDRSAEDAADRLGAIVDSAEDAIIGKTLEGKITSWNRAAEALFGYSASEAIGQSITLIIPPDRQDEEKEILARLRRGEFIQHFETERLTKAGRLIPISLSISPVRNARGELTGASKIARDISDRRRAEQVVASTLRTLEVLYRLVEQIGRAQTREEVSEAAADAVAEALGTDRTSVLLLEDDGRMRFVAWRGLSDAYRAAVNGHSPWAPDAVDPVPILVNDVRGSDLGPLQSVISGEGIGALGFFPLVARGKLLGKFMVYYGEPHAFTPEETRLAVTVAQHVAFGLSRVVSDEAFADSLERERAARQEADVARADAEATNAAKDEFLAMLAHELRNPLAAIVTSAAVVDAVASEPIMRRSVATITRQATHLARLTDDLLDVARIMRRRIELEREPMDLRNAVNLAWEGHRHRAEARRQQVTLTLPNRPVMVRGDAVRLQQVIGNLVSNASKYSPEGGSIWLKVEAEGDEAVVRLRDNGIGIDPRRLEAIFDLFHQENPTLARSDGGLGIGLTLARSVVELHGGTITATSEGLGSGATFSVHLPRIAEEVPLAQAPRTTTTAAVKRRLLLIEDHEDGREALVTLLGRMGHEVEQTATGTEGIEAALRLRPEVVLVDIGLPDTDGYEVARRLRAALGPEVFLVALTGYGQPRDRKLSADAGFDAHLVKPVPAATLMDAIDRLRVDAPG